MSARITISFDGEVDLTTSNVWPDRDGPKQVTAEAVAQCLEACGAKRWVLDEWNLLDSLNVLVTVDGETVTAWEHRPQPGRRPVVASPDGEGH